MTRLYPMPLDPLGAWRCLILPTDWRCSNQSNETNLLKLGKHSMSVESPITATVRENNNSYPSLKILGLPTQPNMPFGLYLPSSVCSATSCKAFAHNQPRHRIINGIVHSIYISLHHLRCTLKYRFCFFNEGQLTSRIPSDPSRRSRGTKIPKHPRENRQFKHVALCIKYEKSK